MQQIYGVKESVLTWGDLMDGGKYILTAVETRFIMRSQQKPYYQSQIMNDLRRAEQ